MELGMKQTTQRLLYQDKQEVAGPELQLCEQRGAKIFERHLKDRINRIQGLIFFLVEDEGRGGIKNDPQYVWVT